MAIARIDHQLSIRPPWVPERLPSLFSTASKNDDQNLQPSDVPRMNNVDTVTSLPTALNAGNNVLSAKVNSQTLPESHSPRTASPPFRAAREDVLKKVDSNQPLSPKADSEAETIIQSGRESLSPEKRKKPIQHDPRRLDAMNDSVNAAHGALSPYDFSPRKRKWMDSDTQINDERDYRPGSPVRRQESSSAALSAIKEEKNEAPASSSNKLDTSRSSPFTFKGEEKNSGSRKRLFSETVEDDTDVSNQVRSQGSSVAPRNREQREVDSAPLTRPAFNEHSMSPTRPTHKRTTSGPPHAITGDMRKKRKAPPPFMIGFQRQASEDRQSASSSTSGSPLPSARLRRLAAGDGSAASPAKLLGQKKRDQNGRTRLARACAAQETEAAKARYAEHPEDLNVADNAGNTPLQIASLEGCAPIVKFLLDSGCEVNTKNIDKDTPLIDAVENGHLEVVKLLLEAGANPRAVNAEGDEPYELVPSELDDYDEIRHVLADAKNNPNSKRRSEERSGFRELSSRRASVVSPRESPVHGARSPPVFGAVPKRKTVRSEATRNDLLWTKATPENLREFAAKGDIAGVANILNVGQKADPESLIAAAKGGHDEVLSLLLGMGDADPDPNPVQGGLQKAGYNTPMLAAIGRGNLEVIKLLLSQPGFNPTRRLYRDRTYFELSRERKGEDWEDEYDLLIDAYDNYLKSKKNRRPDLSSPRRSRDKERESRRPRQRRSPSLTRPRKALESPSTTHRRDTSSRNTSAKEPRRNGTLHPKERPAVGRSRSDNLPKSPDSVDYPRRKARDSDVDSTVRGEESLRRKRSIAGRPPHGRDGRRASPSLSEYLFGKDEDDAPRDNSHGTVSSKPVLKRTRSSVSPETSRRSRLESESRYDGLHKKRRRELSDDVTPSTTNGNTTDIDDLFEEEPKSYRRQKEHDSAERERDYPGKVSLLPEQDQTDHKSLHDTRVKEEREKHEARGLSDIPLEKIDRKRTDVEAEEQQREEVERTKLARKDEVAEKAARHAHEKTGEEERRRKETEQRRVKKVEDDRQKRLERERVRFERQRREQEEQEQQRRNALPNRLRVAANLVGSNDPRARSHAWLKKFMPLVTAQTKQLDPYCDPEFADEKWVPNYLVAPLLATNDLQLRQCKLYSLWCDVLLDWLSNSRMLQLLAGRNAQQQPLSG